MICVANRQRRVALNVDWLQQVALAALKRCRAREIDVHARLRGVGEIEVAIVSDRRIAKVHRDFMGIAGSTDVITFHHGEIVISADTARSCAEEYGRSVEHEVAFYLVHGLLHLAGFDDHTAKDRAVMHRLQDRILRACLRRTGDR